MSPSQFFSDTMRQPVLMTTGKKRLVLPFHLRIHSQFLVLWKGKRELATVTAIRQVEHGYEHKFVFGV